VASKKKVTSKTSDNSLMLLALACAVLVASYFLYTRVSNPNSMQVQPLDMDTSTPKNELSVQLNEQNNSGEYGNALLKEENGKVLVHVEVKNAPSGVSQPAHIHMGSCIDLGAVKYPLTNLVNGVSDTTLNVSLSELESEGALTLNVHKSVALPKQYVSCGNL
jgi:hypothetical protein